MEKIKFRDGYLGYGPGIVAEYHRERQCMLIHGSAHAMNPMVVDGKLRDGSFIAVDDEPVTKLAEPPFDKSINAPVTKADVAKMGGDAGLAPAKPKAAPAAPKVKKPRKAKAAPAAPKAAPAEEKPK